MRSLVILTNTSRTVKGKRPEARYTGLAVRPEEVAGATDGLGETVYLASERQLPDGGVEIQVFIGNANAEDTNTPVASFKAPPEPPFQLSDGNHIVDFRYIAEVNALTIVLAGGDIILVNLEDHLLAGQEKIEVVGSVEAGIKAAQWSPDEELLVLVTGEDNLVEMTKTFDVLAESSLLVEDFGEDKPVNVGWGAQSTQFHGSIGKEGRDAVAGLPAASTLSVPGASHTNEHRQTHLNDTSVRISWRGDGAFFVVSALFSTARTNERQRRLRFYSRTAVLQSTSEPTPELEGCVAWKPSGSIIAATASSGTQVVFFERNGLRRYEFSLKAERPEYDSLVRQLAWNEDSNILAVWIERRGVDDVRKKHCVQLWHRNNYHWYLKQTMYPSTRADSTPEKIIWHPENPSCLFILASSSIEQNVMSWQVFASRRAYPEDSGAVAVTDGARLLFTPFRYQNIPPPMSSLVLEDPRGETPIHAAFCEDVDIVAALMSDGTVNVWKWTFAKGNKHSITQVGNYDTSGGDKAFKGRQVAVTVPASDSPLTLHVLGHTGEAAGDTIWTASINIDDTDSKLLSPKLQALPAYYIRLFSRRDKIYLQDTKGSITCINDTDAGIYRAQASFPEPCDSVSALNDDIFIALSRPGRLYANAKVLASGCTSFSFGLDSLVYTTLQHEAHFLLLKDIEKSMDQEVALKPVTQTLGHSIEPGQSPEKSGAPGQLYARRLERGAQIVTVVPSSMTVVLQMPRGNLETIAPRPLVLQVVRAYLDKKEYGEAFLVCRRHRIDLNILCDHNLEAFLADIPLLVEQIPSTEHLSLLVSGLKGENVTKTMYAALSPVQASQATIPMEDKVDEICRRLRNHLESKDLIRFVNCILTTYACQRPPDLESALKVVARVKVLDRQAADEAVKFIIFLADANTLFDVALGIYDFDLVLAVAQNSQKDPREYVPFLKQLRTYDTHYQHFKIDDHLKRYSKALSNLALADDSHFDEAVAYMQLYELYDDAVRIYATRQTLLSRILDIRGDWLMKDNRCHEAAISYTLAAQPRKAMIAHQKALTWQELFDIALLQKLSGPEIRTLAENVSDGLKSKNRWAEAGRVLLEYARDVKGAVEALSSGGDFAEALRIASLYSNTALASDIVLPSLLESKDRLCEEAEEIEEQVKKQATRLSELREKRLSDSASFYGSLAPGATDDALDNVDMQTDAGTAATTQFTRYTAAQASTRAGTVKSGASRKTARKQMRKAASGAKGSIFEESYLLGSLTRLVAENGRLATLVANTAATNRPLIRLSTTLSREILDEQESSLLSTAHTLEDVVSKLIDCVKSAIDTTWLALGDAKIHDLDAALLADAESEANPNNQDLEVLKKPAKPTLPSLGHWRVPVLSLLEQ